jgi:hypothetical protein
VEYRIFREKELLSTTIYPPTAMIVYIYIGFVGFRDLYTACKLKNDGPFKIEPLNFDG